MNYENMTDFEINKLVAKLAGYIVQEIDDSSMIGMNSKFHEQYPNTVWVAEIDPTTGEQISDWEQKCFTRIADDAWPIMLRNKIGVTPLAGGDFTLWYAHDEFTFDINSMESVYDENPFRAAMIVYLIMNDNQEEK